MSEMTVYQKMTLSTAELIKTVNTEIGYKCCQPFAVRLLDALNAIKITTDAEAKKVSNTILDNLQTLFQGGITSEDYDKIDLVTRGNTVTVSARVQALIRAFRRKGYMMVDTIIPVPKGDDIYFEEVYKDGVGIVYLAKDKRVNTDREITAERLANGYFDKFLCRLELKEVATGKSIMIVSEMSNKEVMFAQSASDNGIFLSEWKEVVNAKGEVVYKAGTKIAKKYKVIYDGTKGNDIKYNEDSMWFKWTAEMVRKTVMRRALKNIKETVPELAPTIMAFDTEYPEKTAEDEEVIINVEGVSNTDVDLSNLTEEQQADVKEILDIYMQNPAAAKADAEEIESVYKSGVPINEIRNKYYAELVNLSKSPNTYPLVKNVILGVAYEKTEN